MLSCEARQVQNTACILYRAPTILLSAVTSMEVPAVARVAVEVDAPMGPLGVAFDDRQMVLINE